MDDQVKGPAIGLMVTSGIGIVAQLLSILMNVLGTGMGAMAGGDEGMMQMMSGGAGIAGNSLAIILGGVIGFGALKMSKLESYTFAVAASILAMIPCLSPCCIIGLPIGIWSLVVLMKPEVKAAFRQ